MADPIRDRLVKRALKVASPFYRQAIGQEIRRQDATEAWAAFEQVLARAIVLAVLEAQGRSADAARQLGAVYETDAAELFQDFDISIAFEAAPFQRAIEAHRRKVPRLAQVVRRWLNLGGTIAAAIRAAEEGGGAMGALLSQSTAIAGAVNNSFWASDVDEQGIVDLRELVGQAIEGGSAKGTSLGLPEYINTAQQQKAINLTDSRLEVIYRNNINRSFAEGQAEVMRQPETIAVIPVLVYDAISDNRTRDTHAAMDGYVASQHQIDRLGIRTPSGHNCRCAWRQVPFGEARRRGWVNSDGSLNQPAIDAHNGPRQQLIRSGAFPDPGWQAGAVA
jgi:SPP1 gp7 family putative phage head morphogenesis protein